MRLFNDYTSVSYGGLVFCERELGRARNAQCFTAALSRKLTVQYSLGRSNVMTDVTSIRLALGSSGGRIPGAFILNVPHNAIIVNASETTAP